MAEIFIKPQEEFFGEVQDLRRYERISPCKKRDNMELVKNFTEPESLTPIDVVADITGLTFDEIRKAIEVIDVEAMLGDVPLSVLTMPQRFIKPQEEAFSGEAQDRSDYKKISQSKKNIKWLSWKL